jgi:hypothetical protein
MCRLILVDIYAWVVGWERAAARSSVDSTPGLHNQNNAVYVFFFVCLRHNCERAAARWCETFPSFPFYVSVVLRTHFVLLLGGILVYVCIRFVGTSGFE